MKSTPVSAPPEAPNPEAAVLDLKRMPAEANGQSRIPSRLPKASRLSKGSKILLWLATAILVLGSAGVVLYIVIAKPFKDLRTDLITHKVQYDHLEQKVVERGALE